MPLNVAPTFGTQNPGVQGFSDFFKSNGVSDQEAPYWASKWDALQQRGQQLGDPGYANRFLSNAETFTGSPEATARNMYGNSGNSGYMGGDNSGLLQQLMQLLQGGGKQYAQPYNPHQPNNGQAHEMNYPQTQVPTQSNGTLLGTTYQPHQYAPDDYSMAAVQSRGGNTGFNGGSLNTPPAHAMTRPFSQNTIQQTPMGAPSFYQAPPSGGIQKPQSQGNMGMSF